MDDPEVERSCWLWEWWYGSYRSFFYPPPSFFHHQVQRGGRAIIRLRVKGAPGEGRPSGIITTTNINLIIIQRGKVSSIKTSDDYQGSLSLWKTTSTLIEKEEEEKESFEFFLFFVVSVMWHMLTLPPGGPHHRHMSFAGECAWFVHSPLLFLFIFSTLSAHTSIAQ